MTTFTGTLTATDGSGQTATASVNVAQTPPPTALTVTNVVAPASAAPGTMRTITATGHGGTPPYTFSISAINGIAPTPTGPGTWTITPPGTAAATLTGTITARDSAGQTATSYVSFTQTAAQPPTTGQAVIHTTGIVWMSNTAGTVAVFPNNSPTEFWFTVNLNAVSDYQGDPNFSHFPKTSPAFLSARGTINGLPVTVDSFIDTYLGFNQSGEAAQHNMYWAWTGTPNHGEIHAPLVNGVTVGAFHFQVRDNDNHIPDPLLVPKGNLPLNIDRMCDMSLWSVQGPLRKITMIYYAPENGEVITMVNHAERVG